jgi:hypothetical protein
MRLGGAITSIFSLVPFEDSTLDVVLDFPMSLYLELRRRNDEKGADVDCLKKWTRTLVTNAQDLATLSEARVSLISSRKHLCIRTY